MHRRAGGFDPLRAFAFIILLLLLLPTAIADEGAADCEDDQPWIGYRSTEPVRAAASDALEGSGLFATACEGEQWDGQDATGADPIVSIGMGADPNGPYGSDIFEPPGARVTLAQNEAYAAFHAPYVARGAVYVGTCGAGEPGLESDASCGGTRELRVGTYLRDNTIGNMLATIVQCMRWIICYVAENDCDYATYVSGQMNPPSACGRDNTAFGATLLLV